MSVYIDVVIDIYVVLMINAIQWESIFSAKRTQIVMRVAVVAIMSALIIQSAQAIRKMETTATKTLNATASIVWKKIKNVLSFHKNL